jgi:hypothetical protein
MSCKFDKEIIQKYVDNTIEPLELIVLKEHIKVCQDCKFELDLMSKLENSMLNYFAELPEHQLPASFMDDVLGKCYEGRSPYSYRDVLSRTWKVNKSIVQNISRYASYMPGSKLAAKYIKKAGHSANNAVKSYVKRSFKRMWTSALK